MADTVSLDLTNDRLALAMVDDDFRVLTIECPFDPSGDEWAFLVRERSDSGDLHEWTVTASDTSYENDEGDEVWPLTVDCDTADLGARNWLWCLFRNSGDPDTLLPYVTGTLVTTEVVQDEVGS